MNKLSFLSKKVSKGFTLIELLIVIAVIGVLAAVVLVAIDPLEQLARGRDAGRKSTTAELGRAMEANYTNRGSYIDPAAAGDWAVTLQTAGDIKTVPTSAGVPATPCLAPGELAAGSQYCLKLDVTAPTNPRVIVYIKTESKSEQSKCPGGTVSFSAYLSAFGRGGTFCKATEPAAADPVSLFMP